MSLSAREQRILSEIERELAATEPLLGRALASMRAGRRTRTVISGRARRPRGTSRAQGWVVVMLAGVGAGIAVTVAGFLLAMLPLVIGGTALTQVSLVAGWLARALSPRRPPRG